MVSSRRQISPCPVCSRTDQVKKMQTAYSSGEIQFAPPPMPESHASMMKYIGVGMILVGVGAFLVLITLSTSGFSWFQLVVTMIFIVAALVLSFFAIRHIGQGDEEARRLYPAWDEAMANWTRLQFCARDKVIFDPRTNKALTDPAVNTLLSMENVERNRLQTQAAASH